MGVHCCCLHVNYIVYKHFVRSLHIGSLDATCVQNFRPVPLTVFEILGFNLKNKNDKKRVWLVRLIINTKLTNFHVQTNKVYWESICCKQV